MKNTILLVVVFLLVAAGGVTAYRAYQDSGKDKSAMMKDEVMMKDEAMAPETAMMKKDETAPDSAMMADKSAYGEYTKTAFDSAAPKRRVLFFYASWCPTCKPADASLTNGADQIPDDVMVFRVNYNDPDTDQDEKALAEKYLVTYQHTFVQVDEQGEVVTRWNGGQIEELLSKII